jgi:type IV pilus assembly protein PilA
VKRKIIGFTLIELMIVVAIIGILASIALPAYQAYVKKSHALEGISLASIAKSAIWDYWSIEGSFPTDNATAGISPAISGNAVAGLTISLNEITIEYNQRVTQGSTIIFKASDNGGGTLTWDCTSGTLEDIYRPPSCR